MIKPTGSTLGAVVFTIFASLMAPDSYGETFACPSGTDRFAEHRLFFGRSRGDVEVVSDSDWQDFLAQEVTPHFPDGLTVLDAAGQWRNTSGIIVRERSKLVLILVPVGKNVMRHIDAIASAYISAFDQESVLRTVTTACVSF